MLVVEGEVVAVEDFDVEEDGAKDGVDEEFVVEELEVEDEVMEELETLTRSVVVEGVGNRL